MGYLHAVHPGTWNFDNVGTRVPQAYGHTSHRREGLRAEESVPCKTHLTHQGRPDLTGIYATGYNARHYVQCGLGSPVHHFWVVGYAPPRQKRSFTVMS